jgi:hypothetical protein
MIFIILYSQILYDVIFLKIPSEANILIGHYYERIFNGLSANDMKR